MAALFPLQQDIFDMANGRFIVVSQVMVTNGSDTLALPEGLSGSTKHVAAIPIDSADTAKTISSISQGAHPAGATVTMTGGTSGSMQFVVSFHVGNTAGL
jgi:hypothetical protein